MTTPTTSARRRAPERPDGPSGRQLVGIEVFAGELNVSTRTVRRWIYEGTLPAYRLAGRGLLRVDLRDLEVVAHRVVPGTTSL